MTSPAVAAQLALAARLRAVAPMLTGSPASDPRSADPAGDAAQVFEEVVAAVELDAVDDKVWLLLTALSAVYPTRAEVDVTRRRFDLDTPVDLRLYLLDTALAKVNAFGSATARIEVLVGAVLVDVDHSAKYDLHTGIQRVARNLMPAWNADRDVVPAAWTDSTSALRRLRVDESDRVIRWAGRATEGTATDRGIKDRDTWADPTDDVEPESPVMKVLVPWRSVVVMVEVPPSEADDRLAAIGRASGNRLVGIAYDAIPVVSGDAVPPVESIKFARYLSAVKFATRLAGISAAATAELAGFVAMLTTQGLVGPVVTEVSLPAAGPSSPAKSTGDSRTPRGTNGRAASTGTRVPTVLSLGSHEPRKNHLAILYASEVLWRGGLEFELLFIGGSGWGDDFPRRAEDLRAAGRPIEVRKGVSDAEVDRELSAALFTVFPSLHEGYGLPVAESMAHGTPVITSNFGSMAEIAAAGGALTIDPRDDAALVTAMRTLLTEPAEVERLVEEIASRPRRGWDDYAGELWAALVAPELSALGSPATVSVPSGSSTDTETGAP